MIRPKKSKVGPPPAGCPLEEVLSFLAGTWTPKVLWYLRAEPSAIWRFEAGFRQDFGKGIDDETSGARVPWNRHAYGDADVSAHG